MAKAKTLMLAEASEEQIEEMQQTGSVLTPDDNDDTSETTDDKENRGAGREEKAPVEFSIADDVERLGDMIVKQNYPELAHVKIIYLFRSAAEKSGGEELIMSTSKKSGLDAWGWQCYLENVSGPGDPFFIITVSQSHWELMSQNGKESMLDSHLARCGVRENSGALYLKKPDVQEFVTVLHRRGFYTNKLKDAAQVIKKHIDQPDLLEAAS